jgi:hypothetical protein
VGEGEPADELVKLEQRMAPEIKVEEKIEEPSVGGLSPNKYLELMEYIDRPDVMSASAIYPEKSSKAPYVLNNSSRE